MKSEKEILDKFGKIIIQECYDEAFGFPIALRIKENPPLMLNDYANLIKKLEESEFEVLKHYHRQVLGSLLFNFLRVFEEHPMFKIYFEDENNKVNLVEISENLKAEPIIKGGWIERFSQYSRKKDESA